MTPTPFSSTGAGSGPAFSSFSSFASALAPPSGSNNGFHDSNDSGTGSNNGSGPMFRAGYYPTQPVGPAFNSQPRLSPFTPVRYRELGRDLMLTFLDYYKLHGT